MIKYCTGIIMLLNMVTGYSCDNTYFINMKWEAHNDMDESLYFPLI